MLERIYLRFYLWVRDFKELVICVICNKRASARIPTRILDELARCFLSDIIAFYDTPEGRKEYEEWKVAQTQQTPQSSAERA